MTNVKKINRQLALFILEDHRDNPLVDQTCQYLEIERDGGTVSGKEWFTLREAHTAVAKRVTDIAFVSQYTAGACHKGSDRIIVSLRELRHFTQTPEVVKYALTLLDDAVPYLPYIATSILNDVQGRVHDLNMATWHSCETVHCLAGFAEIKAGIPGVLLVKHFGHWLTGALIFYKSHGEFPDFYSSTSVALDYLKTMALIEARR